MSRNSHNHPSSFVNSHYVSGEHVNDDDDARNHDRKTGGSRSSGDSKRYGGRIMAARGSHWSFLEKARFEAALHKHGAFAWNAIISAVGTRSEKQVKAYAARYRRRKKLAARVVCDPYRQTIQEPHSPSSTCSYPDDSPSVSANKKRKNCMVGENPSNQISAPYVVNVSSCTSVPVTASLDRVSQVKVVVSPKRDDIDVQREGAGGEDLTRLTSLAHEEHHQRVHDRECQDYEERGDLPDCHSKLALIESPNHQMSSLLSHASNITCSQSVPSTHSLLPTAQSFESLSLTQPTLKCKGETRVNCQVAAHGVSERADATRTVATDFSMTASTFPRTSPLSSFVPKSTQPSTTSQHLPLSAFMSSRVCSSLKCEDARYGAVDMATVDDVCVRGDVTAQSQSQLCPMVELDITTALATSASNMNLDPVTSPGGASSCMSAHVSEGVLDDDDVLLADDEDMPNHSSVPPSNLDEDAHIPTAETDAPSFPSHSDDQFLTLNHEDAAAVDTRFLQHNLYHSEPLDVFSDFVYSL